MGQVLFSPYLLAGEDALPTKSVALCGETDGGLERLFPRSIDGRKKATQSGRNSRLNRYLDPCYEYEVCSVPETKCAKEPTHSLIRPAQRRIHKYWEDVGCTLHLNYPVLGVNNYSVHAIILQDASTKTESGQLVSLADRDVTIVHSRDAILRMYTLGAGTIGAELAWSQKPKRLKSVFLVNDSDSVLDPVIQKIRYLEINTDYAHIKDN
jgi:hypothetical protein